jgi:hypothetical protein
MILTSMHHRKIAKLLRQKAAKLPHAKKILAHKSAGLHMALALEKSPSLAPAAKNPRNQNPPSARSSKPRLASSASQRDLAI